MPDNSTGRTQTLGEAIAAHAETQTAARIAAFKAPPPPDAVIPTTAAEAAARKAEVMADPAWVKEFNAGNQHHVKELRGLTEVIVKDSNQQTEIAVKGELFSGIQPSGHLVAAGTAQMLRDMGLGDAEVRQGITGAPVSADEHAAAVSAKARLMENSDFRTKFMAGDAEAKRTMIRLNIIITSGARRSAA